MEIDLTEQIEDLFKQVRKSVDLAIPIALKGGLQIIETSLLQELARHKVTGDLIGSVITIPPHKSKFNSGYYGIVTVSGKVKKVAYQNYKKVLALEYGTSQQTATPVLRPATIKCQEEVQEKVIEVLQKELGK